LLVPATPGTAECPRFVSPAILVLAALLCAPDAPASGEAPVPVPASADGAAAQPTAHKVTARKAAGPAKPAAKTPATKGAEPMVAASNPGAAEASAAPTPAPAPVPQAAPSPAPPSSEENLLLVERKCGKCHDLSLALSSSLSDANWKLHMKRMANRPGAAITEEQAARIHAFLKATADRR
jgi:hypothetical protein